VILILALAKDAVASHGQRMLRDRGQDVVRLDTTSIPQSTSVTFRWGRHGELRRYLQFEGRTLDLANVRAVWHRRSHAGRPGEVPDEKHRKYVEREVQQLLHYLWLDLGVPFLPAPQARIIDAQDKLQQLSLAASLGFEIPPSIVTNDPDEFLSFYREHGGRVIAKALAHASYDEAGLTADFMRFTEMVTLRDVAAFRSVRHCPIYVQGYVSKKLELRVTVVGERVFAAAIDSQSSAHSRIDWRKYDYARTPYTNHDMPEATAKQLVALTRKLGLRYGAIDLILTPDDRYVFLEINPAGEYQWVEHMTGMPITSAICDELIRMREEKANE